MTPSTKTHARTLRTALALAAVLLLANPALGQGATLGTTLDLGLGADENAIYCWVTAYGDPARDGAYLDAHGFFGTKCETTQTTHPLGGDPVPPVVRTYIAGEIEYCSYTQNCRLWTGDSGNVDMHPTRPMGFWIEAADKLLVESCKVFVPPLFDYACEVLAYSWTYSHHLEMGEWCGATCREGGIVEYRGTHRISIEPGTGYHLIPGTSTGPPRIGIPATDGGCVVQDRYNLVCASNYRAKASSPQPVVLPPAAQEPVDDVKQECVDRFGHRTCNP